MTGYETREELESDAALPLHLLLAVFKFDHMEWAIEKATELGVEAIVPVYTSHSDPGLRHGAMKRAERWRRIARENQAAHFALEPGFDLRDVRRRTRPKIQRPAETRLPLIRDPALKTESDRSSTRRRSMTTRVEGEAVLSMEVS